MSGGFLSRGLCPGGFVRGGFVLIPRTTIFGVRLAKVIKLLPFKKIFWPVCRYGDGQFDQIMVSNPFWCSSNFLCV